MLRWFKTEKWLSFDLAGSALQFGIDLFTDLANLRDRSGRFDWRNCRWPFGLMRSIMRGEDRCNHSFINGTAYCIRFVKTFIPVSVIVCTCHELRCGNAKLS